MSWYKISQAKIENFLERNLINKQIRELTDISKRLDYLSDLVFQTAGEARKEIRSIMGDKKMSSFPDAQHNLKIADNIVYDNPWKFAQICQFVARDIMSKTKKLEKERKDFAQKYLPNHMYKGLRN